MSPCTRFVPDARPAEAGHYERGTGPRSPPTKEAGTAFLALFDMVRQRFRPDVLLSYGGQGFMFPLFRRARKQGVKVVFALHNLEYTGTELFHEVDAILVPSQSAQEHYRRTLGLESMALPGSTARAGSLRGLPKRDSFHVAPVSRAVVRQRLFLKLLI